MTQQTQTNQIQINQTRANRPEKTNTPRPDSHDVSIPCLWMQAGVVKKKACTHYYDCATCKYDSGMLKMTGMGRLSWQDAMRTHEGRDRTCRHAMTLRTGHRTCPMNYNCARCDFDQMFEETLSPAVPPGPAQIKSVKGFQLAQGHYFHSGHTWACIENGGFIRVGMDDFAFKVLGQPDGFDLPLMGQELKQNKAGWGIQRNQNAADVQSPINGVITRVNPKVRKSPDLPGRDPYADGWLFTLHNNDLKGAVKDLFADEASLAWLNQEVTHLEQMIEEVTGPLSADGGFLRSDVYGNLPALGWQNLTRKFLGT